MATTPPELRESVAWIGGADYGEKRKYVDRIANFHSTLPLARVSNPIPRFPLRRGTLSAGFSVGNFNYVREITFGDSIQ